MKYIASIPARTGARGDDAGSVHTVYAYAYFVCALTSLYVHPLIMFVFRMFERCLLYNRRLLVAVCSSFRVRNWMWLNFGMHCVC